MSTSFPCVVRGVFKARYLVSVAAAVMLAACSASVERFSQNPSDADPVYTASVPTQQDSADSGSASDGAIVSKPLAGASLRTPGGGYNYDTANRTTINQQPVQVPQVANVEPAITEEATAGSGGKVTVASGMTLYSIAKANGMTVAQLAAANGLKPPYSVQTGQVLRIPGSSAAVTPAQKTHTAAAQPAKVHHTTAGETHEVASGETLFSLGRKYGVSPYAIADLNGLSHKATLNVGQSLKIPASGDAAVHVAAKSTTTTPTKAATGASDQLPADQTIADNSETPATKPAGSDATTTAQQVPDATDQVSPSDQIASADPGIAGMRWPVRGKVISSFGAKPNGLKNEGINIAVPEGTSIRAADDGVVAYAGNELKGYGNLILIRHQGGYVTAYAHAKELFVKRGDTVKRGDVIAKAGQTGSVSSPQLHFEVRKGATAMDPLKFLTSSTALN
jgi:murein DD-endopeptidase MepM/ murein hydrolase activator NlpD